MILRGFLFGFIIEFYQKRISLHPAIKIMRNFTIVQFFFLNTATQVFEQMAPIVFISHFCFKPKQKQFVQFLAWVVDAVNKGSIIVANDWWMPKNLSL